MREYEEMERERENINVDFQTVQDQIYLANFQVSRDKRLVFQTIKLYFLPAADVQLNWI